MPAYIVYDHSDNSFNQNDSEDLSCMEGINPENLRLASEFLRKSLVSDYGAPCEYSESIRKTYSDLYFVVEALGLIDLRIATVDEVNVAICNYCVDKGSKTLRELSTLANHILLYLGRKEDELMNIELAGRKCHPRLSPYEFEKALPWVDESSCEWLQLMYASGMRLKEMLALSDEDIRETPFGYRFWIYFIAKNGDRFEELEEEKQREVHVFKEARASLSYMIKEAPKFREDILEYGMEDTFFAIQDYLGLSKPVTSKTIRQSYADRLFEMGCRVDEVAKHLGISINACKRDYYTNFLDLMNPLT